jgi:hypothetical protein
MALPARGAKRTTLYPLEPALDTNEGYLSPTQPRLNDGASGCQGNRGMCEGSLFLLASNFLIICRHTSDYAG